MEKQPVEEREEEQEEEDHGDTMMKRAKLLLRARIQRHLNHYAPSSIKKLSYTLEHSALPDLHYLLESLIKEYGEEPASPYRDHLVTLLQRYCPEMLSEVEELLHNYVDREEELIAYITQTYGADAENTSSVAHEPTSYIIAQSVPCAVAHGGAPLFPACKGGGAEEERQEGCRLAETFLRALQLDAKPVSDPRASAVLEWDAMRIRSVALGIGMSLHEAVLLSSLTTEQWEAALHLPREECDVMEEGNGTKKNPVHMVCTEHHVKCTLWCVDDGKPICTMCSLIGSHQSHRSLALGNAATLWSSTNTNMYAHRAREEEGKLRERLYALSQEERQCCEYYKAQVEMLEGYAEQLKKALDTRVQEYKALCRNAILSSHTHYQKKATVLHFTLRELAKRRHQLLHAVEHKDVWSGLEARAALHRTTDSAWLQALDQTATTAGEPCASVVARIAFHLPSQLSIEKALPKLFTEGTTASGSGAPQIGRPGIQDGERESAGVLGLDPTQQQPLSSHPPMQGDEGGTVLFCGELDYTADHDEEGVVYYLGTRGYTRPFINPYTSGDIHITASTGFHPRSVGTEETLSSRVWNVFTVTKESPGSWVCLDLRSYRMLVTHYTITHGFRCPKMALRCWVLEGSVDAETWDVLYTHENEEALVTPIPSRSETETETDHNVNVERYVSHTWHVESGSKSLHRYLRIRLLGPAHETNTHHICVCGLEFYGTLFRHVPMDSGKAALP